MASEDAPNVFPGPPWRTRILGWLARLAIVAAIAVWLCFAGGAIWALVEHRPLLHAVAMAMLVGGILGVVGGAMLVYAAGSEDPGYSIAGGTQFAWTPAQMLSMNAYLAGPAYMLIFPTAALLFGLSFLLVRI